MIGGKRAEARSELRPAAIGKLLGVELHRKRMPSRSLEHARDLVRRKSDVFAKTVDGIGQTLRGDMRQLKSGVQVVADNNITHAQEIIESAGMYFMKRLKRAKTPIAVRYGGGLGLVELLAKAISGKGSYEWQMSSNQVDWMDLPPTVKASTSVSGLTPATIYYFRFRTLTVTGYSDWSIAISYIAH